MDRRRSFPKIIVLLLLGHLERLTRTDIMRWKSRNFSAPSPEKIKRARLIANGLPNATWVETGTYMGDTAYALSKVAEKVITIEPSPELWRRADKRFKKLDVVEALFGTSEEVLPTLVPQLSGSVVFWLDGHYSAGVTFQGERDTPIVLELEIIAASIKNFKRLVVLVDDIRCFNAHSGYWRDYPSLDFLVDWARQNGLQWHIEHDIFIAKNFFQASELGGDQFLGT